MDFIGIDFSGDADQWRYHVSKPNVWIARLSSNAVPEVLSLQPVQQLPGSGEPFDRLVELLAKGDFLAAGIDAPFSVPASYVPKGDWNGLIETISNLPHDGRPFPRADTFLDSITGGDWRSYPRKVFRLTDRFWARRKINVRSTLWWQPRGGAPFAAACMKLIGMAGQPCWPWVQAAEPGILVEAFPAAQLREWKLNHQKYNGDEGHVTRGQIVDKLRDRINFADSDEIVRKSADALDAVLAAFAGIACRRGTWRKPDLEHAIFEKIKVEGWISVHR